MCDGTPLVDSDAERILLRTRREDSADKSREGESHEALAFRAQGNRRESCCCAMAQRVNLLPDWFWR
jgi:adenylate kinase